MIALAWAAALAVQGPTTPAAIAQRVGAVRDGAVRLAFTARAGVVGDGRTMIGWDCTDWGRCRHQHIEGDPGHGRRDDWRQFIDSGPVRVSLRVRDGAVTSLRTVVGGSWAAADSAVDLGVVPAAAAARYLLGVARRHDGRAGRDAVFAATLADSVTLWPDLLALARDTSVRRDTRKAAVFWVGQAAGDAATAGLDALAAADSAELEIREAAVFALSQRPRDEGVPALIRIARTHREPRLRRRALFWLAHSADPRALDLFEEILTRK